MIEHNPNKILKTRLTATPPHWAEASIAALRQMPFLEVFEANIPVDNITIDIVLHFGIYSDAVYRQYGIGHLGFWFFRFGGQDLDVTTAARHTTKTK